MKKKPERCLQLSSQCEFSHKMERSTTQTACFPPHQVHNIKEASGIPRGEHQSQTSIARTQTGAGIDRPRNDGVRQLKFRTRSGAESAATRT